MQKLKENWLFISILALSILVRFLNITKSSVWHDEGYTVLMIKQGLLDITKTTAIDVHPPLYYYFLHFWSLIFGTSELAIRSMSAVFGIGVVVIMYLLVKKVFDKNTALLAMAFAAFSPFFIRYSQEARMYGVEGFWTILGTYFLFLALDKEYLEKAKTFWQKYKYWIFYVLSMAAAIYTHYYALLLVFAQWGYVLIRSFANGERYILKKEWWLSNISVGAIFLPWVPNVLKQFTKVQSGYWIPPVSFKTIPETIVGSFTYDIPHFTNVIYFVLFLLFFIIADLAITRNKEKVNEIIFFLLYFLIPTTLIFLVSLRQPVYQNRYFVFAMAGVYIILAAFISSYKNIIFKTLAIVFLLGTMVFKIDSVYSQASHQMKEAANLINTEFQAGDGLAAAELYVYLDYDYYNKTGQRAKLVNDGEIRNNNEMAFIYRDKENLVRKYWSEVETTTGIIWVVGKTNPDDYKKIPSFWQLLKDEKFGYTEIRKYQVR